MQRRRHDRSRCRQLRRRHPHHPQGQQLQQPRQGQGPGRAGSVNDALRLGCSAIGFTIYPGSDYAFEMMEEIRDLAEEAKAAGLAVVVWS
jgi:DhnA family fructose-bisphosphate aldolase class Ia